MRQFAAGPAPVSAKGRVTNMKVTLLAHTPQPEHILAAAARLCYSPATIDDVMESLTEEKTASFVEMLAEIGHESPIEHASFTFGIEGVSRSLLAQITRHRLASFSVQSQRYVAETMFEYVVPPQIADIPEAADEFRRAMEEDQRHYESLTARLKEKHLADKLAAGMGEKEANRAAEKQAKAAAQAKAEKSKDETPAVEAPKKRSLFGSGFRLSKAESAKEEKKAEKAPAKTSGDAANADSTEGNSIIGKIKKGSEAKDSAK